MNMGIRSADSTLAVVIKKNMNIPTSNTRIFGTSEDNQKIASVTVFEGERILANDNHKLGEFYITNIDPAPAGKMKFEIIFDITADSILKVSAKDLLKGNMFEITVNSNTLTKEEIQKMHEDAEKNRHRDALIKTVIDTQITF